MTELLMASLVGGLISLDRTAFLQIMISQPLIAGTLVGFSLGDPITGLTIGSMLELLWIGAVPVGSSIPPNETAAAVIATSVSIISGKGMESFHASPMPVIVFSVLLAIPLAMAGQKVDIYVRGYNKRFALNADRLWESGNFLAIGRENLKGLLSFFISSFFSLIVLTGFGLFVTKTFYPLIPGYFLKGLSVASYFLVSLGIAVSIRTAKGKGLVPLFSAGFLMGMVLMYFKG